MSYNGVILKKSISINKIYSIHYFEYMSNFSFEGETHDFWEFICVDKGEVNVTAGSDTTILKRGDIAFHQPNEFHSVQKVIGHTAEDLGVAFTLGGLGNFGLRNFLWDRQGIRVPTGNREDCAQPGRNFLPLRRRRHGIFQRKNAVFLYYNKYR